MWIEERTKKDGTIVYAYYERYTDPRTGKTKKVSVTLPTSSRAAIKQATMILSQKIEDKINRTETTNTPLTTVFKEFLDWHALSDKPATLYNRKQILNSLVKELPTNITVNKIGINHLQRLIIAWTKKGISRGYITKKIQVLKQAIRYAKRYGYVDDISYLEQVEIPKIKKTPEQIQRHRHKYMEPDELKHVLKLIRERHPRIGLALEFQSLTGLRFGELSALREQDYDGEKINVNGTITNYATAADGKRLPERVAPKTAGSYRDVLLSERAKEIINYFIAENYRFKHWYRGYVDKGYIFTTNTGNPIRLREVNRLLNGLKLDKPVTTHMFRHTHISTLLAQGVPINVVMERVGHTSSKITLEIYTHVMKSQQEQVKSVLDKLYS